MATQKGLVKIEGSLDDLTFYKRGDKYLARTRGGVSKSRIMTEPSFARTRENLEEFGMLAQASKQLRNALATMIRKAYDGTLHTRLMQTFNRIKKCDLTSVRGKRQAWEGLATPQGKALLKGMDLNARTPMGTVLSAPMVLDPLTGAITIAGFVPSQMLTPPTHATHVSLEAAMLNIDFQSGAAVISYSAAVTLLLDNTEATQTLTPTTVAAGTGTTLYLLLVEFTQEINGEQYALHNGNFNALKVVEVG